MHECPSKHMHMYLCVSVHDRLVHIYIYIDINTYKIKLDNE